MHLGYDIDWKRIDKALRSHASKIKQVLFLDSIVGAEGVREGAELYEAEVKRMRSHTDLKNASLYSFSVDGSFGVPNEQFSCEFFDSIRELARGRLAAFEAMQMRPIREAGGLENMLTSPLFDLSQSVGDFLLGEKGRVAFEEYRETGDESVLAALYEEALEAALTRTEETDDAN